MTERAASIYDQRHRLVLSYVWEIPFAKSWKGPQGLVLGGWSVGGIITMASGRPFNILQSGDTWNNDALWPRPNAVEGAAPRLEDRTATAWFNTNAFARSTTYGTSPALPPAAIVFFAGDDARVGPVTHYVLVEPHGDVR